MENPGLAGEYGFLALLLVLTVVASLVGLGIYAGLKLGLKNPDDIP